MDGHLIGSQQCLKEYQFKQLPEKEQAKRCGNGAMGCGGILKKSQDRIQALGVIFHAECFTCVTCGSEFEDDDYLTVEGVRAFVTEKCVRDFEAARRVCVSDFAGD